MKNVRNILLDAVDYNSVPNTNPQKIYPQSFSHLILLFRTRNKFSGKKKYPPPPNKNQGFTWSLKSHIPYLCKQGQYWFYCPCFMEQFYTIIVFIAEGLFITLHIIQLRREVCWSQTEVVIQKLGSRRHSRDGIPEMVFQRRNFRGGILEAVFQRW